MDLKEKLIQFIIQKNDYITSRQIAEELNISTRSVVNYVNQINKECGKIILSCNKGYYLIPTFNAESLNITENTIIPRNYEERKHYILEKLLISNEHPDIDTLAASLCISITTLQNEIAKIRAELKSQGLYIKIKKGQFFIIGNDKDRRKAILDLLNNELEDSYFNIDSIQKFFYAVQIKDINNIVTNTLNEYEYFLDDFSLLNYVLHLAICIETGSSKDSAISISQQSSFSYTPHIQTIVDQIYNKLKKQYQISFTSEQIYDASILMSTRIVSKDLNKITFNQLDNYVGKEIKDLLLEISYSVHDIYGIDLKVDNFMVRFAFHLKNLVTRINNKIFVPDHNFDSIQVEFPFLYIIAVHIASIINKKYECVLAKSEISYIALHLGVLMEEKKAYEQKISCALVIFDYLNISNHITQSLQRFSDTLFLVDIVTSYDNISNIQDIDLILTTLPINPQISTSQLQINMIPSKSDINNIHKKVMEIKEGKILKDRIKNIQRFFTSQLFFPNAEFDSQKDAIETLSNQLILHGYANENFKKQLYDHEDIAPSAYRNIAIPHPLYSETNSAIKSTIVVALCKKPIQWASNQINIIFVICLTKEDFPLFRDLFSLVTHFLSDEKNMQKLLSVSNYNEFIEVLSQS